MVRFIWRRFISPTYINITNVGCEQEANLYQNLFKSFFIVSRMDSVYSCLKIRQCLYNHLSSVLQLIKIHLGVEQEDHHPVICLEPAKVTTAEVTEGNYLETGEKIVPSLV